MQKVQQVVEEAGRQCILLPGDLTSEAQCKSVVQQTVDKFGRIDVLVNNAAYQVLPGLPVPAHRVSCHTHCLCPRTAVDSC